jgi:hypothetical protein
MVIRALERDDRKGPIRFKLNGLMAIGTQASAL